MSDFKDEDDSFYDDICLEEEYEKDLEKELHGNCPSCGGTGADHNGCMCEWCRGTGDK